MDSCVTSRTLRKTGARIRITVRKAWIARAPTAAVSSKAVIKELDFDLLRVNVNGGAIALGHPLGATGAKLTTQLIYELATRGCGLGMVTMSIGGGMRAAGIFEVCPS